MQHSFGHTLKFSLSRSSASWLRLGPGWAALAGVLSTGQAEFDLTTLLQFLTLWLLVDPILGTLWEIAVQQGIWRQVVQAQLPSAPRHGFSLPYAQPGSMAGRFVLKLRRYQAWRQTHYGTRWGDNFITFTWGSLLALSIGFFLSPPILGLTLLALGFILLAGQSSADLSTPTGGRLQSVVQFLLPWSMAILLWTALTPLNLILGICFWVTYLGGLRMFGHHQRAHILFYLGQLTAILMLFALRLLPGAAILSVLFITQLIISINFDQPQDFLPKAQPYLIIALVVAGLSLGNF